MSMIGQFDSAALTPERFGQLNEQMLDASRAAAKLFLEVYENTLESIATYQEQAATQTELDWFASAAMAQAKLTRELAKHQVSMGRELLK
jgi:hypothetical protein